MPDNKTTKAMKQVWFPGCHASVGGSDLDHQLSDIALAWMIQKLADHTPQLEIDISYLKEGRSGWARNPMDQPWGCAKFDDSFNGIYTLSGSRWRTPGQYQKNQPGVTNEFIHRCVDVRMERVKGYTESTPDIKGMPFEDFGEVEEQLRWPCISLPI
jgi:Uncharacterized alpha/beta hydrolase domain (DUF2235)